MEKPGIYCEWFWDFVEDKTCCKLQYQQFSEFCTFLSVFQTKPTYLYHHAQKLKLIYISK